MTEQLTYKCKIDSWWEVTIQCKELSSVLCDNLEGWNWRGGREVQEGGDIYTHITDSLRYIAETNTTL